MSDSLQSYELQHARFPGPSPSPRVCSNSCLLNQLYYPTISSSVASSSCPQSFPVSGSFPMSRLFASGGQSIRASASASVLPMNNQGWFPLGLTGLIFKNLLHHQFQSINSVDYAVSTIVLSILIMDLYLSLALFYTWKGYRRNTRFIHSTNRSLPSICQLLF